MERDEIAAIEAGDDWTPLENRKNIVAGSALDFSAMGWTDAPAGKHGWLKAVDEPGMPLICLVNEGPMKWTWNTIKKMDCVKEKWSAWRETQECSQLFTNPHCSQIANTNLSASVPLCAILPADPALIENFADSAAAQCFAAFVEREAFVREKAYLESLGCKALLTSQNCSDDQTMAALRETFDYVDNHCYLDHPKFLGKLWSGAFRLDPGGNPVKVESGPLANAAFTRIAGKPYTLTEWNLPGPGQYRGAGGLLMGAMAARQEWSGMWRFAYSHVERGLADGYGAPHLFDLSVDPVNLASERAVMCLFLRGDMAPLETSSRILVTHLTDAQAEGNVFADRARSILLKWGKGRTLVRNGSARVSLALDNPESCEVWGLGTDGTRMERIPAADENGRLSFTADVDSGRGARLFYEIWRKP